MHTLETSLSLDSQSESCFVLCPESASAHRSATADAADAAAATAAAAAAADAAITAVAANGACNQLTYRL